MSGYRTFTDSTGVDWEVWEVVPRGLRLDAPDRRRGERRTVRADSVRPERRYRDRRLGLASTLGGGWLVFRSAGERRRFAPVPDGWERWPEQELERHSRLAVRMGDSR